MKKAFTLIELMIVIAIIGLLAAIIIPNAKKARARAEWRSKQNQPSLNYNPQKATNDTPSISTPLQNK